MAKREYIQRHLLIIRKLQSQPSTFESIKKYLLQEQELTGENFDISQRTFQRDLKEINTIYGLDIKHNKKESWYEIADELDEKPFERILEAFETLSALNSSERISNKLILEKKAKKGTKYMHDILYAIENNFEIQIKHQSYWKDNPEVRIIQPIAIKESQNRWYLICIDISKKAFRNFGLDRIQKLEILDQKFKPIEFDITTYYQNAFGIETYEPAVKIILNFNNDQSKYIKSLPLHTSQKIIFENKDWCQFEYYMHPTNDFVMEIMKYGDSVKVEEPLTLKEAVRNRIVNTLNLYN